MDALAARVGARHDLVSRATTALSQCLREASADEGHTYLPWHRLEAAARRLLREAALQHAAPWDHSDELHLVAQHMHATGRLVAEPPAPPADEAAEAAAQADGQLPLGGGGGGAAHLAPARLHPSFDGVAELRGYLASKLEPQGGGRLAQGRCRERGGACSAAWATLAGCLPARVPACLRIAHSHAAASFARRRQGGHSGLPAGWAGRGGAGSAGCRPPARGAAAHVREGRRVARTFVCCAQPACLAAALRCPVGGAPKGAAGAPVCRPAPSPVPTCCRPLPLPCSKCRTVGPKTAEKIKAAWEAAHGSGAGAGGKRDEREGLTMAELAEAPPALGFAWGPDVRCFVPHLHEAEQTVAQRVLQAAAAYREPSARQLGRVRKWLAANQATTGARPGCRPWACSSRVACVSSVPALLLVLSPRLPLLRPSSVCQARPSLLPRPLLPALPRRHPAVRGPAARHRAGV